MPSKKSPSKIPAVGDIVHYGGSSMTYAPTGQVFVYPYAALITAVWEKDGVNLRVFDPVSPSTKLKKDVKYSPMLKHGCWSWPKRVKAGPRRGKR